MRAIQVTQYLKSPDQLKVVDVPDPTPKDDEYLVEIRAAAANFFDILQIQGRYQTQPPFPWVAGFEFAGVVLAVPPGNPSPRFPVGARVYGGSQGAYATRLCATEPFLRPVPRGWSLPAAAGLSVTLPTSYAALAVRAALRPGETVLVHAAAGGVGLAAVQVAKALGARVVATAGDAAKLRVARAFGADEAVAYSDPRWPERVRALTGGRGVDVVYDPVGLVEPSLKCTAFNGRILVVGFAGGAIEKLALNKVLLKSVSIVGVHWGAWPKMDPAGVPGIWKGIDELIEQGKLRGTEFTDEEFVGLESVGRALVALGSRKTWGKVVITIPQDGTSKL